MKKTILSLGAALSVALVPAAAFAQSNVNLSYFENIIITLRNLLDIIAPFIIGLAFVWFLWGVFRYVVTADAEKKEQAKDTIIYGIIGLAVMLSVWGLVRFVQQVVGINTTSTPTLPNVPR